MTTRQTLVEDMQGMETIILDLEGVTPAPGAVGQEGGAYDLPVPVAHSGVDDKEGNAMTEKDEQIALFDWASYRPDLRLMYHITNEGRRTVQHTVSLLRQGMKPGVPDICLPVARGGYHGLYIELKTKTGRQSPEQKQWQRDLLQEGYCAVVCHGFDAAREVIDWYMKGAKR